jgi:sugar O-acyltransferase (sialic acid O-acetyltransferase NeuD family)
MRTESLLIWGAGGHGKVVAEIARMSGHQVEGFVDRDPARLGRLADPGGGRVVLTESDFLSRVQGEGELAGATAMGLGIGDNARRHACLELTGELALPVLVHPSAVISPSVQLGRGTVIIALAGINAAAVLGAGVIVNTSAVVGHDCVLGDASHISGGAVLAGGVRVGARSWVGAGAVVIGGVVIGSDVIVGAGAVVIRDVPDGSTVVGNPARIINRGRDRDVASRT